MQDYTPIFGLTVLRNDSPITEVTQASFQLNFDSLNSLNYFNDDLGTNTLKLQYYVDFNSPLT